MRFNIYLIFPLLLFSCVINANNRPGFVCGKFNGNVVEVPREYVDFIAEYEGYSYFDRRAINNKKGCDANFTVLPLRMTWPEMKPVDRIKADQNKEEIKIAVKPLTNSNATMNKFRDNSINNDFFGKRSGVYYDDELDLYFIEYLKEDAITYNGISYLDRRRVYWSEDKDEVTSIIDCNWLTLKGGYYRCDINGRIPEIDAYFQTDIKWSQIRQWERILVKSKEFVINHLK
ncbi:hypothetical protein [Providencia vermicola]|uniref:hypothetical protein n=1 Tax=Providencia vermicola TaxID=333965 RepID=UPI001CEDE438|nr:hypothetical protein [Providencia vermicola]